MLVVDSCKLRLESKSGVRNSLANQFRQGVLEFLIDYQTAIHYY